MEFVDIMLSEDRQREKNYIISFMCDILGGGEAKLIEAESRIVVFRSWGMENGKIFIKGINFWHKTNRF